MAVRARVRITRNKVVTGEDIGAVFLDGNRLCFAGRCMSFAITQSDLATDGGGGTWKTRGYRSFCLRHSGIPVELFLKYVGFDNLAEAKKLRDIESEFMNRKGEPAGKGELPPLQPAPWIWRGFGLSDRRSFAAGILACVSIAGGYFAGADFIGVFLLFLFVNVAVWTNAIDRHRFFARLDSELRSLDGQVADAR